MRLTWTCWQGDSEAIRRQPSPCRASSEVRPVSALAPTRASGREYFAQGRHFTSSAMSFTSSASPEFVPRPALPGIFELMGEEPTAETVREVHVLFLSETQSCLDCITDAAARVDAEQLGLYLHRLQGSASSVGAEELAALTRALERAVKAGRVETAVACLPDLHTLWASLKLAVERDLQRLPGS